MGLYDQSGNEYHFTFEDNDNKYMPEYHQSYLTYNNVIKFHSRSILFLTKPISYKNIKLMIKMSIQDDIKTNIDLNIADAAIKTAINNKDKATSSLNNAVDAKNRAQITAAENGNRRSFKNTEEDAQDEAAEAAIKTNYEKENRRMLEENAQKVVDAVAEAFTNNNSEELTAALEAQKNAQDTYDKVIELLNKPNYIQDTRSLLNANQRKELSQEFQRIRDRLDKATNEVNRIRDKETNELNRIRNKEQALNEITTRRNARLNARLNARRDEESETTKVPDDATHENAITDATNYLKNKENDLKSAQDNYNNNKSNYVDTYMDFLAKRGSSTVKITISDTTPSKEFNIEYNEYKTKLSIDNNFTFDIENKTDNITFECIGNILDSRTDQEKRDGKNLGEMINKHSFRGLLSELRIFKNV
jgi:HD-GYP domain-containing protein (c-di-GMP phosphodiesterase class II)